MAKFSRHFLTILVLCCIAFQKSLAKPATALESGPDPAAVSAIAVPGSTDEDDSLLRDERSPDYGLNDYYDYSDEGSSSSRHYKNKHKHKPTYVPVPVIVHSGNGCRGHGQNCGGSYHKPSYGGGHHGSSASASASAGSGHHHGGSQAQAQSASASFGPISFSVAQAQASSRGENYGGYGNYGNYGYDY